MKLDRVKLLAVLDRVKPALASSKGLAELNNVWFGDDHVLAYDGGMGIRVPFESRLEGGLSGAVLMGLLNSTTVKEVEFDDADEGELLLKLGRTKAVLAMLAPDRRTWPFPSELPKKALELLLTEEIFEALRKALLVKAATPTRVEHHGVSIFPEKKTARLYGFDSQIAVEVVIKAELEDEFEKLVLPRGFVEQLLRQCEVGVSLIYNPDDFVAVEGKEVALYSNLMSRDDVTHLPDLMDKFISGKETVTAVPAGLGALLDRVAVLAPKDALLVDVETGGKTLVVSGKYPAGTIDETFELDKPLPTAKFRLRSDLIQVALKEANSFAVASGAVAFYGADDCLFAIGTHQATDSTKEQKAPRKAKDGAKGKEAKEPEEPQEDAEETDAHRQRRGGAKDDKAQADEPAPRGRRGREEEKAPAKEERSERSRKSSKEPEEPSSRRGNKEEAREEPRRRGREEERSSRRK